MPLGPSAAGAVEDAGAAVEGAGVAGAVDDGAAEDAGVPQAAKVNTISAQRTIAVILLIFITIVSFIAHIVRAKSHPKKGRSPCRYVSKRNRHFYYICVRLKKPLGKTDIICTFLAFFT